MARPIFDWVGLFRIGATSGDGTISGSICKDCEDHWTSASSGHEVKAFLTGLLGIPISGLFGAIAGSYLDINGGNGDAVGFIIGIIAYLCIWIMHKLLCMVREETVR